MSDKFPSLFLLLPISLIVACNQGIVESTVTNIPENFTTHCASCHGKDLKGDIAQSLLDGSWQFGSRTNDITRSIKFGHPHHGMPSWQHVLDQAEIDSMVSFLLAEEARLGIEKPPLPDVLETQDYLVEVDVIAEGLDVPWSLDFLDARRALITEKTGRLRLMEDGQIRPNSIEGIPQVRDLGQGGLLDVAIDPEYAQNGWIYLSFSHAIASDDGSKPAPAMTSVVRGRINGQQWVDQESLFEASHDTYRTAHQHFGSRIVFDSDGLLYFSIGDRGAGDHAQDLTKPNGKIHRIGRDGSIPRTNPFYEQAGALKSIFSIGHRNPQGLAIHPTTGDIWSTEHGPLGGDELNLIKKGVNYGWPVISYGINYNGAIITDLQRKEGMEQPILYWKPSIAVCGLHFYHGDAFPMWKNRLMVGSLKFEELQLLEIEKDRVIYRQTILKNGGRVRDVTVGPDGFIYVVLNRPGKIICLRPKVES